MNDFMTPILFMGVQVMSYGSEFKRLGVAAGALGALLGSSALSQAADDIVVSTTTSGLTLTPVNHSSLDSLTITSTGVLNGSGSNGISNSTTIGTIVNAGSVSGYEGLFSTGTIGSIVNTGLIHANPDAGVWADGATSSIGSIDNSGTIDGTVGMVIQHGAHLGVLNNSGTISGSYAIANLSNDGGTIDSIVNTGLISGIGASIYNYSGTFGPITNSGVIAGDMFSLLGLTLNGGAGSTFGILTGYDQTTQGSILLLGGDLVFGTGNLLLNDNVSVSSGVVSNQAANLQINNTVTVYGNYQQGVGANLLIGVADGAVATGDPATDSGYGRLVVSGSANIASGSTVSLTSLNSYAFASGQRYAVVQAVNAGTDYNADDLTYLASGFSGVITGVAQTDSADSSLTDLVVSLGSSGPVNNATTRDAVSSLDGLFAYGGTDASLLNLFNASAALGSTAEANRAGAQLSPASVASTSAQTSTASSSAVLQTIAQHADLGRLSGNHPMGIATGEEAKDAAVWSQAVGGAINQQKRDEISGYDAGFGGLLIGADAAAGDHWRLGGAGSYTATSADSKGDNKGSSVNTNSFGLFGYANYEGNLGFLNLSAGVLHHQYDSSRLISFSGFNSEANGSFDGMEYIVSGRTGYPVKLDAGDTTLTPIAGLTYSALKQDGYTETGGNGAGLTVDDASLTSLKSDLSLRLDRSIALSGGELRPFVQLGWQHEFHDDAMRSTASFTADNTGATGFVTNGFSPVADSGLLSVGATFASDADLSVTLKYTGEFAQGYQSHAGDVRVRLAF